MQLTQECNHIASQIDSGDLGLEDNHTEADQQPILQSNRGGSEW
jgi:hypothetical protein